MFTIIYLLFCVNILAQRNYDDIKENYCDVKSLYPECLVNHLPKLEQSKLFFYEFRFPRGRYLSHIHLGMIYSDEEIDLLNNEVIPKAKGIYHFTDSCSMIVDYNSTLYDSAPFSLKMCSSSLNMLPIPNFEFLKEANLPIDFYKNASIYVLDAEQGKFLADDCLSREGVGLSNEWLHGYTKGVAIHGKTAVYWLEVW